jgi:hypothetical protein
MRAAFGGAGGSARISALGLPLTRSCGGEGGSGITRTPDSMNSTVIASAAEGSENSRLRPASRAQSAITEGSRRRYRFSAISAAAHSTGGVLIRAGTRDAPPRRRP